MKRRFIVACVLSTLFICLALFIWASTMNIVLRLPYGFVPDIVYVTPGNLVTFINLSNKPSWPASSPHPTHTSYSEFDPKESLPLFGTWSFAFNEDGIYTFHDHLAPEYKGIVVVGDADMSRMAQRNACDSLQDTRQQTTCIEMYFRNIAATVPYQEARALYEELAVLYPNACHDFAHELGQNAYRTYLDGELPHIGEEASSCAYGLWHGFTTAMQKDRGFAASKEFCASFGGETEELAEVNRMNCYHGIGIGLIPDPPEEHLWGNFQEVVTPGLNFCDTVTGNSLYTERCLTGIFHGITNYMTNNQYGFTYTKDSLAYCAMQKQEHQYECFVTLVAALPRVSKDIGETVSILKQYSPSDKIFTDMFINAAIMSVDIEDSVATLGEFLSDCEAIDPTLRVRCITAVVNNLFSNGAPGSEYFKALEFCIGPWIRNEEQRDCYIEVMQHAHRMYTPQKLREVCTLLPEEYQNSVPRCLEGAGV